jgi:hypothetical protein
MNKLRSIYLLRSICCIYILGLERKTAKPNIAKQINSKVAVSEPPETVNQSNQDNAREESHTNPTDNSNLQGNVDENKEYEHKFLGQERAHGLYFFAKKLPLLRNLYHK